MPKQGGTDLARVNLRATARRSLSLVIAALFMLALLSAPATARPWKSDYGPGIDHVDAAGANPASLSGWAIFEDPGSLSWSICLPGLPCAPYTQPSGPGMPDAGSNEVLADPPIGTRFVLSATWDGAAHSKTSNAWQGRITVTGPPALSGSRVRDIARFTDLTWTGGWGVERPITTIASCRTADLRDCMAIYSSVYFPGCNGAAVSPADRGRYLAVSQWLADDRTAFPLVGLTPPVPVGLFVDLRGSVSVTGPVTGTAPGRVPRCAWWRDRLPALTVRRTIDSSESEPPIAQAHCFDNCKFRVYIQQDRVRRSFLASIQPAYKSMRISLPKRLARRLKAGQATVTVLHRGRRIATREVKVE